METNRDRCMVLDDGREDIICSNSQSVGAERIPMKIIENLCDIWIPAHLLSKRKSFTNKNLNKPAIFHKLERTSEDYFSVYNENVDQVENFFADELAQEDMLDLLNNYASLEANVYDEVVSPTEAFINSENNDHVNSIKSSEKESLSSNCLEKNSVTITCCDKETDDYMQSASSKTAIQSNYENVNTSLNDIYNSYDEIDKEVISATFEDVSMKKSDSLVTPLNISEAQASALIEKNLESNTEEGACFNPCFESSVVSEKSEMNYNDESEGDNVLVNFPVAYKRPLIKENEKKQKNQKKKKNTKKKVFLDVFTQNSSECSYPEVDKFYESVMNKYSEYGDHSDIYDHEYPSLKIEHEDINTLEVALQFGEFRETENLSDSEYSTSPSLSQTDHTCSNLEITGDIVVMENFPKCVSTEQVQDLLTNGEVRSLYLSKCGQFKNAKIRMDSDADAEWIIECFNGVAPFGADSSTLKCYKLS